MTIEKNTRPLMEVFVGENGREKSPPSPVKKEPTEKKSAANKPTEIFSFQTFTERITDKSLSTRVNTRKYKNDTSGNIKIAFPEV